VFNGDRTNVPARVDIKQRVSIQITSLDDWHFGKPDEQGVGVGEISDFHGLNPAIEVRDLAQRRK
jgi:hypothetical protein